MKTEWTVETLGKLCQIKTGKKDVNQGNPDGKYPFFTCAASHTFSDTYSFDTEALLVAGNGDVGKVSYFKGKFEVYQRTYVLSDFVKVLPRFLYFILDGKLKDTVSKQKLGNTMPYIKIGMLSDFAVPVPPLPEQQRIVRILDEAFEGIASAKANAEHNLQNARALFESHVEAVFTQRDEGWMEKQLVRCVEEVSTGPFGSILHKSDYQHGGIPLVNPINIEGDKIVPDERKAVGKATAQRLARYALRENDIVIARRGEIGRCAVVTRQQSGWLCGTGSFVIRPSDGTDPHFLTHLLRSRPYRGRLEGMAGRATMPSISNHDLANLVIRLPPVAQQCRMVALIEELSGETERLATLYERKLRVLEALKESLLHSAFSGNL